MSSRDMQNCLKSNIVLGAQNVAAPRNQVMLIVAEAMSKSLFIIIAVVLILYLTFVILKNSGVLDY